MKGGRGLTPLPFCVKRRQKMKWKIIARHKWVAGATITESYNDDEERRFTATIDGYRNWRIYEGHLREDLAMEVIRIVKYIQNEIRKGNEEIFSRKEYSKEGQR
jgi:hypothetical protein